MGVVNDPYSLLVVPLTVHPNNKQNTSRVRQTEEEGNDQDSDFSDFGDDWTKLESLVGIYPGRVNQSKKVTVEGSGGIGDERVTVRGLVPGSPAMESEYIDVGDIVEQINEQSATLGSIESVLAAIESPTVVLLTIRKSSPVKGSQRSAASEYLIKANKYNCSPYVKLDTFELNSEGHLVKVDPCAAADRSEELGTNANRGTIRGLCAIRILPLLSSDTGHYCFPSSFSSSHEQLDETLKGMTLTLFDLVDNSFNNDRPKSMSVKVASCRLNIAFWKMTHHSFMLICEESLISLDVLLTLLQLYKTLVGSFVASDLSEMLLRTEPSLQRSLKESLDYVFKSTLPTFKRAAIDFSLLFHLQFPETVELSVHSQNLVDELLIEFECGAWRMEAGYLIGQRKPFLINGSCLFYKDALVWNSLCDDQFHPVHLFLASMDIIGSSKATQSYSPKDSQLMLWRELFVECPESNEFEVFSGRSFLLVVRMKGFTYCVIMESGACANSYLSREEDPEIKCPDPYYREALNVVYSLKRSEIEHEIINRMTRECDPAIACAESFLGPSVEPHLEVEKPSTMQRLQQVFSRDKRGVAPSVRVVMRQQSPSSRRKRTKRGVVELPRRTSPSPSRFSTQSNAPSSATTHSDMASSLNLPSSNSIENVAVTRRRHSSSNPMTTRRRQQSAPPGERLGGLTRSSQSINKDGTKNYNLSSVQHANTVSSGTGSETMPNSASMLSLDNRSMFYEELHITEETELSAITLPTKVVGGIENSLLFYLDLRPAETRCPTEGGVAAPQLFAFHPSIEQVYQMGGEMHVQIVHNFYRAAFKMRKQFLKKSCFELGWLFTCRQPEEKPKSETSEKVSRKKHKDGLVIKYWVIGRQFEEENGRQVFICHQDNCAQNMAEVAFKLLLTHH